MLRFSIDTRPLVVVGRCVWLSFAVLVSIALVAVALAGCGGREASSSPQRRQVSTSRVPSGSVGGLPPAQTVSLGSSQLSSVSCSTSGYCLIEAVSDQFWLVAHGSSPVQVAPAPVAVSKNSLIGEGRVSCFSDQRCMVMLFSPDVVEFRDGHWLSPSEMSLGHILTGLGCSDSGVCFAIDGLGDAYFFNGTSWSTAVNAWGAAEYVVCKSRQFCLAVGGGVSQWNGETWTQPTDIDPGATMTDVACVSVSNCVAVDNRGRVIRFDAGHWSVVRQVTRVGFVGIATLGNGKYLLLTSSGTFFLLGASGATRVGSLGSTNDRLTGLACAPLRSDRVCYVTSVSGVLYVQKVPPRVLG
jgi:hypothetical protein